MQLEPPALVAVLLVLLAVLFGQAWATRQLVDAGVARDLALDLPRLVGLPLLLIATGWIAVAAGHRPTRLGSRRPPRRLVATAIAIGCLARVAAWAQLTVCGAFGWFGIGADLPPVPFQAGWSCPGALRVLLGVTTWCVLVPVTEEFVHRGIVQNALAHRGAWVAVGGSALIFTLCHDPAGYATVFALGVLFGCMYWQTGVLWYPVIAHAVYDGLRLLDRGCLQLAWQPAEVPAWPAGLVAGVLWVLSLSALVRLLRSNRAAP